MSLSFKFNSVELSDEEFTAKANSKEGGQYAPGIYDMRVVDAKFMKMSEKDPTWAQYRLILSVDGEKVLVGEENGKEKLTIQDKKGAKTKSIRLTVLVPTAKESYGDGPGKLFMFRKLKEFYAALGETLQCSKESMKALIPRYFNKPDTLRGTIVNVLVGYTKPYLKKDGDVIRIVKADGSNFNEEEFPDFDAAKLWAATQEKPVTISNFVEIIKFNPPPIHNDAEEEDEVNPFTELDSTPVVTEGEEW